VAGQIDILAALCVFKMYMTFTYACIVAHNYNILFINHIWTANISWVNCAQK